MASVNRYDVVFEDGRERVKKLTKEDAERLEAADGVKSVSRQAEGKRSRQRNES